MQHKTRSDSPPPPPLTKNSIATKFPHLFQLSADLLESDKVTFVQTAAVKISPITESYSGQSTYDQLY